MSTSITLNQRLTARFLRGLLATPAGRAHLLNEIADAEATDEGAIFDRLLLHVQDPKLRQMITRHRDDELRHAELLLGCLARTGFAPTPVPPELRLLDRIDALAGHPMQEPVKDDKDVMVAYVMLLVIEERAINQFHQFIPAFAEVDPETADVFRQIARDEERHLKYCHAISRRYAPGEATWAATVDHFRMLEARAFAANSRANMQHVFARNLHTAGPVERFAWLVGQGLLARSNTGPRTQYWGTHAAPQLAQA